MSDTRPKDNFHIPDEQQEKVVSTSEDQLVRRILLLWGIFTLAVTLLRLIGRPQTVFGLIDTFAFKGRGGPLLFLLSSVGWELVMRSITIGGWLYILLPIAILIYAKQSRIDEHCRPFLMVFSIFSILNPIAYLLAGGWMALAMHPGYLPFMLVPIAICLGMIAVFCWCRELARLRAARGETVASTRDYICAVCVVALVLLLTVTLSKTLWDLQTAAQQKITQENVDADLRIITSDDYTVLRCNTRTMRASPDGKLLAVGGMAELSVWDVATRKEVFSDPSISVYSLRFSPSGKYLAAVGTGIPNDKSCIALYEVQGFKRLSQIALSTASSREKRTIRDIAFCPGENSLIYVYYDRWIEELLTSDEVKEKEEERIRLLNANTDLKWTPLCEEMIIATGKIINRKTLPGLREPSLDSLRLSPDGSLLAYIHTFTEWGRPKHRNFTFYDTTTWAEKVFQQSKDVRIAAPFGGDSEGWFGHRSFLTWNGGTSEYTLDGSGLGKVYFTYEQYDDLKITDKLEKVIKKSDNLGEIDIRNMTSSDLYCELEKDNDIFSPTFSSIGFSPDGKKIALLAGNTMRILEIEKKGEPLFLRWRSKAQIDTPKLNTWGYGRCIAWVNQNTVAIAVNAMPLHKLEEPKFFFQKVPEKGAE